MVKQNLESWGGFPRSSPRECLTIPNEALQDPTVLGNLLLAGQPPYLVYGLGRSYGDACLNNQGCLLTTAEIGGEIVFNEERNTITVSAGTTIGQILQRLVPMGWMLPVVPGTQWVTIGGAIANDIHGKNHHAVGSFGNHVLQLWVWHNGSLMVCSTHENSELFTATVGGLGLTGIILRAELQLIPIGGSTMDVTEIKATSIESTIALLEQGNAQHAYTVAWLDGSRGRGLVQWANHRNGGVIKFPKPREIATPWFSRYLLTDCTVALGNAAYYHRTMRGTRKYTPAMQSFFFPLDVLQHWNRAYGSRGLLQYQFVVPFDRGKNTVESVFSCLRLNSVYPYLSVVKTFGDVRSIGMMSFPMKGITVAVDVRNTQQAKVALDACDTIVADAGGRVYLAKDARMCAGMFETMYGRMRRTFEPWIDKGFSSSLWRRVTGDGI